MKPIRPPQITLMLLILLAGCSEQQPEILDNIFFSPSDPWIERDAVEDPNEWVDGVCCNDFTPFPMAIDSTIQGVINPASDLDYYDIRIDTIANAGQLFLFPRDNDLTMRLFTREVDEYKELALDTGFLLSGEAVIWTTLVGSETNYTVLIEGASGGAEGRYSLWWVRWVPVTYLTVERPTAGDRLRRGMDHRILWQQDRFEAITLALMRGSVVIDILKRNHSVMLHEIRWIPSEDLEPGNDYRIMIYLSKDPTAVDISNAFEIY